VHLIRFVPSIPLGFELKAVIIAMISTSNIHIPRCLIADSEVVRIILVARDDRFSVSEAFVLQDRSFLPLFGVEYLLWMVDGNAIEVGA
jgi:hypothetical protein